MRNLRFMHGMIAASALLLAAPALAGDEERARAAIAEAQGKIDAAGRINADKMVPEEFAQAQAALRLAQEELKSGHEQKAIQAAIAAQASADGVIGIAQKRQQDKVASQSSSVAAAQQAAAEANDRAQAAEQAASAAQADAAAARSAPPVVVAAAVPAPAPETTVTTETTRTVAPAPARARAATARRTTVKRTAARRSARQVETTRTTVTTAQR